MPLDTILIPPAATNAHDQLLALLGLATPAHAAWSNTPTPVLDAEEDEDEDEWDDDEDEEDCFMTTCPECEEEVLNYADVVGSTTRLLNEVQTSKAKKFIVATEDGIFHQMKKSRPDVTLIQAPTDEGCVCNQCPYMKLNTLEKIRDALKFLKPQVNVDETLRKKAEIPLQRMMDISEGRNVVWPN